MSADDAMRLARFKTCIEVECKECRESIGYAPGREAAWGLLFQHADIVHNVHETPSAPSRGTE
jgi:hypothetical protein